MQKFSHAHTHTSIHTYMNTHQEFCTYTHTSIHTYTRSLSLSLSLARYLSLSLSLFLSFSLSLALSLSLSLPLSRARSLSIVLSSYLSLLLSVSLSLFLPLCVCPESPLTNGTFEAWNNSRSLRGGRRRLCRCSQQLMPAWCLLSDTAWMMPGQCWFITGRVLILVRGDSWEGDGGRHGMHHRPHAVCVAKSYCSSALNGDGRTRVVKKGGRMTRQRSEFGSLPRDLGLLAIQILENGHPSIPHSILRNFHPRSLLDWLPITCHQLRVC